LDSQAIATHPEQEHAKHPPYLHHHFATVAQQKETSTFGMWLFLLTEIMFFGGLFCAYLIYQLVLPGFRRRQPSTVDRAGCDEYGGADLLEYPVASSKLGRALPGRIFQPIPSRRKI
jgi:heme/copper-type cytochrome/quinol oxidase subunit 3